MVYTINSINITYDPKKCQANIDARGVSFDRVVELDWTNAIIRPDERKDYGEVRLRVFGLLDGRLHVAVVTPRKEGLRVISFRKANEKEKKYYAETR